MSVAIITEEYHAFRERLDLYRLFRFVRNVTRQNRDESHILKLGPGIDVFQRALRNTCEHNVKAKIFNYTFQNVGQIVFILDCQHLHAAICAELRLIAFRYISLEANSSAVAVKHDVVGIQIDIKQSTVGDMDIFDFIIRVLLQRADVVERCLNVDASQRIGNEQTGLHRNSDQHELAAGITPALENSTNSCAFQY